MPALGAEANPLLRTLIVKGNNNASMYMSSLPALFPSIENFELHDWLPRLGARVVLDGLLNMPLWNLEALVLDVSYMFTENFTQVHQNRKAIRITIINQGRRVVRFRFDGHQFVQTERLADNTYTLQITVNSLRRLHTYYGNNNQTIHIDELLAIE